MESILSPSLTEPGVLYFLKESLKKCNEKKTIFYNTLFNLGFLFIFISILGILLVYKKHSKLTPDEIKNKKILSQQYMLEKIKSFREKRQKEENEIITTLPRFESNFVKLHKNYYTV